MQLLLVSAYFDSHKGGIEIVAGRLAREFRKSGHDVTWLASDATSAPVQPDACDRAVAIRASNITERLLGIPFPIPGLGALAAIRREVRSTDAVLLHDTLYLANIVAFLLARWARKPVIVTQHIATIPYRNPLLRGLMRLMNRIVARPILGAANQVIFISEATARAFGTVKFRRPPQFIFNGVDTDLFHPVVDANEKAAARRRFGLPIDRPLALFVGRFVEKKGLNVLRRAAEMDRHTDWVIAGWGPLDPRTWNLPNVHMISGLSEATLAPLYRASDAFVLPSVGEGFPLVLQEALASGLPAICGTDTARADKNSEALLHTIEVDMRDTDTTAAHLVQALHIAICDDTPEQTAHRSDCIRKWYSWPGAAKHHLELINDVANAHAIAGSTASQVRSGMGTKR
jgi:glycosyltransferase involved in cell wall biosynthesis